MNAVGPSRQFARREDMSEVGAKLAAEISASRNNEDRVQNFAEIGHSKETTRDLRSAKCCARLLSSATSLASPLGGLMG
jgi:hypothetical protein